MNLSGYEEIEHTADVALRVWGTDFDTLLKQSAQGVYDLMGVEPDKETPKQNEFSIEHSFPEMVLVDFLNEILYLTEVDSVIYDTFTFYDHQDGQTVYASGYGIKSIKRMIKAVTFHNLEIVETAKGFETTITFDV
jgi:SHS2 domain-containing protein